MSDQELVDKLESVWRSIDAVCADLAVAEWLLPTDCPGWTVRDQLSHLVGGESNLLGRPAPEHSPSGDLAHVRNPIGHNNEVHVDFRRSRTGAEVLDEFREVIAERLAALRSWTKEDFDQESWTPLGPGTVRDFLGIRLFDAWVHEQDIRRAVGRPGDLEGPVAEHAFARIASAVPFVVGKKVGAPDGTMVVFEITGPAGRTFAVGVDGGRAKPVEPPSAPTAKLTMDLQTFNCLGCGRRTADQCADEVRIEGDEDLAGKILANMNFMI